MDARAKPTINEAIHDEVGIERACISTARKLLKQHRFNGLPLIVSRDNQVVEISAEDFERALNEREAKLNASLLNSTDD